MSVPSQLELALVWNSVAVMRIVSWEKSAAQMDVVMSVQPYRIVPRVENRVHNVY